MDIPGPLQTRGETRCPGGAASSAWLAAPAMNVRDTTKVYIWKLDTWCGPTLYRKCHSHNTPGKRHNNTWVEPLAGNCSTSFTRQREQVWQTCKIQKNWCTITLAPTIEHHGGLSRTPANQRWDQVPGRSSVSCLASHTRHECPRHNESVYMEAWHLIKYKSYWQWHSYQRLGQKEWLRISNY